MRDIGLLFFSNVIICFWHWPHRVSWEEFCCLHFFFKRVYTELYSFFFTCLIEFMREAIWAWGVLCVKAFLDYKFNFFNI